MAKINSKKKGNRGEIEVVHILEKRFGEGKFKRTPSSGAYVGGKNREGCKNLPWEARIVLASDIIVPMEFKFIIEHKFYADISFWELFSEKSNWQEWIDQADGDATFVERQPLIVIKYNQHKRIALIKKEYLLKEIERMKINFDTKEFTWRGYSVVQFEDLLKLPNDFWLSGDING